MSSSTAASPSVLIEIQTGMQRGVAAEHLQSFSAWEDDHTAYSDADCSLLRAQTTIVERECAGCNLATAAPPRRIVPA